MSSIEGIFDSRSPSKRLPYLDSLRGVAALYVVVYHMSLVPNFRPAVPAWLHWFVGFGGSGVTLFFIINAFSLGLTMSRHIKSGRPFVSFFLSRLFRIAPLFYVLIFATYIRDVLVYGKWQSLSTVVAGLTMTFNLIPGYQTGIVWASWTIGVEVLFYVVFPFLYFGFKTPASRACAGLSTCLLAMALPGLAHVVAPLAPKLASQYVQFTVIRHLPIFIIGLLALDARKWIIKNESSRSIGAAMILFGILGLTYIVAKSVRTIFPFDAYYWKGACYASILLGLSICPVRAVVNRATTFIGTCSYSVYLIHAPAIWFLSPIYQKVYSMRAPYTVSFSVCYGFTLLIVVPLAWGAYQLIEKPGERVGKHLIRRLTSPPPTRAQTSEA